MATKKILVLIFCLLKQNISMSTCYKLFPHTPKPLEEEIVTFLRIDHDIFPKRPHMVAKDLGIRGDGEMFVLMRMVRKLQN